MINSIKIQNFQSHVNTTLDLDPGVTAIVGPSDCGKSVVFRALNWIFNNRPGGNEFHSWAGGDPYGSVILDESIQVCRLKIKSTNYYILTPSKKSYDDILEIIATPPEKRKKEDLVFEAFGTTVPEPIQKALNISDINFQFQLDDPFLFGETPGNIARKLNEVVDLAVIDKALFNINQRYRQEVNQLKNAEDKKEALSDELEEYVWLANADASLTELEQLDQSVIHNKQQALAIEIIIKEIYHIEKEIDQVSSGSIKAENEIQELINLDNQIDKNFKDSQILDDLIGEIDGLKEEIEKAERYLRFESAVQDALALDDAITTRWNDRLKFRVLVDHIKIDQRTFDNKKLELEATENKFHELMPEVCPLCDQEVKNV